MYEEIIESYSNDSTETIKEEVLEFLAKIWEKPCLEYREKIESREEYKRKEEAWERLSRMAGGNKELEKAILKLDNFISYQSALSMDLFCQCAIAAYLAKKDLKESIPEAVKFCRTGEYRKHLSEICPENYDRLRKEFEEYRQCIIDKLGEAAANIIDDFERLESEAEEPAYIIRYIGTYLDVQMIVECMKVSLMN